MGGRSARRDPSPVAGARSGDRPRCRDSDDRNRDPMGGRSGVAPGPEGAALFRSTRQSDPALAGRPRRDALPRSEEHTSELQSLMRISYAVFCLKKKKYLNYDTLAK